MKPHGAGHLERRTSAIPIGLLPLRDRLPIVSRENSVTACGLGAASPMGNSRARASTAGSDWKHSFRFLSHRQRPTHCGPSVNQSQRPKADIQRPVGKCNPGQRVCVTTASTAA